MKILRTPSLRSHFTALREKCPKTEFFLARIFLCSDNFHAVLVLIKKKSVLQIAGTKSIINSLPDKLEVFFFIHFHIIISPRNGLLHKIFFSFKPPNSGFLYSDKVTISFIYQESSVLIE